MSARHMRAQPVDAAIRESLRQTEPRDRHPWDAEWRAHLEAMQALVQAKKRKPRYHVTSPRP